MASERAAGALANLGRGPSWVAGKQNRESAAGLWPVPRTTVVNGMSEAAAELFDLPFVRVEGKDFQDLE